MGIRVGWITMEILVGEKHKMKGNLRFYSVFGCIYFHMKQFFLRIDPIVTRKKLSPLFSYNDKKKMLVLSYIPISSYSSSIKEEMLPFYSLHRLVCNIDLLYNNLSNIFPELTANKVLKIKKSIKDGTYTLSPLRLSVFSKSKIGELKRPKYNYVIHVHEQPNLCYGVNPTQEDNLVLMGLGMMLNQKIVKDNLLMEHSLGMKTLLKDYLGIVCSRVYVSILSKFDLTNSMKSLNRENLWSKLSHIVMDREIIELVVQFLYLPIKDESGIEYNTRVNIPSSGLITDVLLNFALIEFDKEFQRLFPQLYYTRYINEVFVSFSTSESKQGKTLEIFEQQVVSLFDQLNLEGKIISIGPGNAHVPCLGGLVSVSQDDLIQVQVKKEQ